ncbi:hypothetical protein PAHAL_3G004600 [Panicum hallii]|uniref:Uncharacterized protein n=1 Tax=Panicum hallii TaxID=206008 RepID=A0A2T8KGH1_9POAL|nr:hypothetical protein PAHAL_3G004600 [Panicum hallii]
MPSPWRAVTYLSGGSSSFIVELDPLLLVLSLSQREREREGRVGPDWNRPLRGIILLSRIE